MFVASYHKDYFYKKGFNSLDEIEKYNNENNIENYNLHEETTLDSLIYGGYIVCRRR